MIDIIIPIKNKSSINEVIDHLEQSQNYNLIHKIIIIDFDQQEPSYRKKETHKKTVTIYFNNNIFNKSLAINIGVYNSKNDKIIVCDGDVVMSDTFIEYCEKKIEEGTMINLSHVVESIDNSKRDAPGICGFDRRDYIKINGYYSGYKGWGSEDRDFIERMKRKNIQCLSYSSGLHISHSDKERIQNYTQKSIDETRYKNRELLKNRLEDMNSEGSYVQDINTYLCSLKKDVYETI